MAKPRPWTVGSHEPFERLDEHLWHVADQVPGVPFNRHMTVVRLSSGELLIHNAICMDEESMARLEALGTPRYLIVPNHYHRLDAHAYKQRYPQLVVLSPRKSVNKVKLVPVDGDYDSAPSDPHLHLEMLDGGSEGVMRYTNDAGETTLVFNDTLFNLGKPPGFKGLVIRMMGSAGGPKVTRIGRMLVVDDRHALAAHLARLASEPKLHRIIPGHGALITDDAPDTLLGVARKLSPRI